MIHFIDPVQDLGAGLLTVEKPNRYVGGEYGRLARRDAVLKTLIAFPDLYEIGMSNQALKILYNRLNAIDGVSCDRAFAPAPDFEALLKKQGLPLYGLDTGVRLGDLDLLMVTLGYELGITGVLTMLAVSSIAIHAAERGEGAPIVLMGGPCVVNPLPYQDFIDAFWIGEAEDDFFALTEQLLALKKAGAGRAELLAMLVAHPSVWARGKASARRAIDTRFAEREPAAAVLPVPSMKVIQQHGAVEIMRGCPNGCRFCLAGYWYRPMRQKSVETIRREADAFVKLGGYREISLSSLSSGDYQGIETLVDRLNREYARDHVSFQLPSLRVSSFSLPLLAKISEVRKSGLTFAVETPVDAWQLALNKQVSLDHVTSILKEARKQGWRGAKFYFMIGLPVPILEKSAHEEVEIVGFILELAKRTGMHFNINVGTFVPKPHTPYQWSAQLGEQDARAKLEYIRYELKTRGHKVGIQEPFVSTLEGVLSRGDERVGALIEEAYRHGCRLDAWSEHIQKEVWRAIFERHEALVRETLGARDPETPLPWRGVESGVLPTYLKNEHGKSDSAEVTSLCIENCTHYCGICTNGVKTVQNSIHDDNNHEDVLTSVPLEEDPLPAFQKGVPTWRILFSFTKTGSAVFQPHLALVELFSMAMTRAGTPVLYTQGFNPLPRLEIAAPLSLGIIAKAEIAAIDTRVLLPAEDFRQALNHELPEGIHIEAAMNVSIPFGAKKHSLSALLWGYAYEHGAQIDQVRATDDKQYRQTRFAPDASVYGLTRLAVLAKRIEEPDSPEPYFTVYGALYPDP
ncbi:MAG: TIGR03936 family radical SAM-associated protein [Treponema sp.]|jgi:radical SAM superfamily enzyme YgiQ (UPF0313 family)|nr:TIGR03936 family radical SAM-associated protein [Treponema sp.]